MALSAGAALAAPATASATPANITVACQANGQVHFNPGVTVFPSDQDVTYQGQDGPCNDYSMYNIRSATFTANFNGVSLGCLESGSSGFSSGTGSIDWTDRSGNTGRSTLSLQIDGSSLNVGHLSGYVRDGYFVGHSFSATVETSLLGGAGKCTIGGGLKDASFTGDFSII
ncbi:hypothetical protein ACH4E7_03095 [Kitasatospora sp. NPDC018058]|uniref:hypothetical protein n=1 Tax=Kitasatospora sp. NPDC018058 TaxID=3364025 RepID=UPI0037BEE354